MLKKKLMFLFLTLVLGLGVSAAPWASHNGRRKPKTLIVVGNYKTPRLMADTILSLTGQPYLLIAENGQIFMVLKKMTMEIPRKKVGTYINNTGVSRVVIIGDESYVSDDFERDLRTINLRRIPIVRIYGENWVRVAEELDDLLNIGHLASEFRRNADDMALRDRPLHDSSKIRKEPGMTPMEPAPATVEVTEVPVAAPAAAVPAAAAPAEEVAPPAVPEE